ncbi:MAG: Lrp/AsnC ligand binding domain-containing protein [Candidatus Poseidoniaceae archaeon]|jgi:DNA-binding Lrp family transcriptional regulator|nr:Lrp/AsnC ligand binding domain-containing protein [Candidatus Poseidoniaceae archaeon]MBL6889838.1 Lrp/AsnC ligand binding domain-containing protein [Candidatus Poseidoniaceae archaeon]MDA8777790.1 Lrp/AsnC ligand binding domain-containing protein [Candidatus Poseidoniales archaeon]MDB2367369.1 Lrp/AsnC ligand binding domain-containing protein [Candidatus Poseidoniales archaeon]|tara:strand:- start:919 stop:1152 length:234 start_codon:yes stop_codon:yes gene_type:complete
MAIGFVLITTNPGDEEKVRTALDSIEHVTARWMLFGEFDIIARVQADDEFVLTRCIVEEIRPIQGIKDTKTMIGAEL